ncbi:PqiC family protein [Paraburkholderia sp. HD33-4]|uniref:PqiC family protein n=1 Tax=Paraburkholderia sp. HD33-4 TaxID=2883242 RepID=UPI001F42E60C|nr:PqiC family protein [Paraburkholderia sp. HD33-4]
MTPRPANPARRVLAALKITTVPLAAVVVGLIGISIAGCGHSPPTRYITLNATPVAMPIATAQIQPIQLTAVHIPAELDRPEVVTQLSPNRLSVDDTDRWGAPLAQMIRRTLAQDLVTRLPEGSFVLPDAPAPPETRTLVVTVLDSEADARGTLTLQAAWTLLTGHPARASLTQQATFKSEMTNPGAPAQAAALSNVLGQLADRIAMSIVAH